MTDLILARPVQWYQEVSQAEGKEGAAGMCVRVELSAMEEGG